MVHAVLLPALALGYMGGRPARMGAGGVRMMGAGGMRMGAFERAKLDRRSLIDAARLAGAGAVARTLAPGFAWAEGDALPPPPADITLPYLGEDVPLAKLLGSRATLIVNIKLDDPNTGADMAPMEYIGQRLGPKGLRVIGVPTDQGWFEPDTSDVVRQKAKYSYDYGGTLNAILVDKLNVEAPRQHPYYKYLVETLPTPGGGKRIGLNYEKFLLDSSGRPLRRYPRRFPLASIAPDVEAILAVEGEVPSPDEQRKALPKATAAWEAAWTEASAEAKRSEYAFRPSGINRSYYTGYGMDMKDAASDLKPK
jgi:glutathione peroxidase